MLCVVIKGPTWEEILQQLTAASSYADCVELRLDLFSHIDIVALKQLREAWAMPMIFTLRCRSHGGSYAHSEENRLNEIRQLAALKPTYIDLEYNVLPSFIKEISCSYPEIKIILSYHNFTETPTDLDSLYQEMQHPSAHFYKIAVTANCSLDALHLLIWAKGKEGRVIAVSMGPQGQFGRIIGPILGIPITYASLDDGLATASGQLSAKTLKEQYHFSKLSSLTAIYGLIGDPVDASISDQTHNAFMGSNNLAAVYVKISVKPSQLAEFLLLAKQLPFRGLSVTMPLKESVIPLLDQIDPEAESIGAVNTLFFYGGKIHGYNTDGKGALNAIERTGSIEGKRVVIIGAGGAARAIAYEACRRGASVTIVNRDSEKAHRLANRFSCSSKGLEQMHICTNDGYDLLINTTPVAMPTPSEYILSTAMIMDIKTRPVETALIKCALKKGCSVIYGYQMFVEQAHGQFALWFGNTYSPLIHRENSKHQLQFKRKDAKV